MTLKSLENARKFIDEIITSKNECPQCGSTLPIFFGPEPFPCDKCGYKPEISKRRPDRKLKQKLESAEKFLKMNMK